MSVLDAIIKRLMERVEDHRPRTVARGYCPECETRTVTRTEQYDYLPVCETCEWTGWYEEDY